MDFLLVLILIALSQRDTKHNGWIKFGQEEDGRILSRWLNLSDQPERYQSLGVLILSSVTNLDQTFLMIIPLKYSIMVSLQLKTRLIRHSSINVQPKVSKYIFMNRIRNSYNYLPRLKCKLMISCIISSLR